MMTTAIIIQNLYKQFTLHNQGGTNIPVFVDFSAEVKMGESVAIVGPSGQGKSSLLKLIYGTYQATSGVINVLHQGAPFNVIDAAPHEILALRRSTIGYVTQFLRCIPRVSAEDVVAEPLRERGMALDEARAKARDLLARVNIPEPLWHLPPMTFSGGEQQRVNIARGFAAHFPILLLDEPTASLDAENRARVMTLIEDAKQRGSTIIGVFHHADERQQVCNRQIDIALTQSHEMKS